MSNIKTYQINASGHAPEIEVQFGQANWGNYLVFLYDRDGKNPVKISEGVNTDDIVDKCTVGSASDLNQRLLYWRLRTARFDNNPGGRFYMKVIISQAGYEPYVEEYQGDMANITQDAIGMVRFVTA